MRGQVGDGVRVGQGWNRNLVGMGGNGSEIGWKLNQRR